MSTARIRVVNEDNTLGEVLPDAVNIQYLDSSSDVGTVQFDYPRMGRNKELLAPLQEMAILVDGKELPNGRFRIDQDQEQAVSDNALFVTWNGLTLMGRLDEAIVLPEADDHTREDALTPQEQDALKKAKAEWLAQAKKDAIKAAKEKAAQHNARVTGTSSGGAHHTDTSGLNHWGKRAVNWAYKQISTPSQSWAGQCQSFVRQAYGLPSIYGSAHAAWDGGRKRTRLNSTPEDIPAGVPVYYSPNHVVLSTGGGYCISTDALRAGQADEVQIIELANGAIWSLPLRGWSPDESGVAIYP